MLKKISSYTFALVALILLNSCKKEYESIESIDNTKIQNYITSNNITNAVEDPDKTGFYYQVVNEGTGEFFRADGTPDSVLYTLTVKSLLNGTSYYTTSAISNFGTYVGYASVLSYSSSERALSLPSLRTVLQKLKPGGSAKIFLPSYLAFGKNGSVALNVPSNDNIELTVTTYTQKSQRALDDKRITDYLAAKGLTATKDPGTGVYYSVIQTGTGDKIANLESTIKANYTGRYFDGSVLDSSTDGTFSTDLLSVVPGWQLLAELPEAKKGAKLRLFIPSSEAYGSAGSTNQSTGQEVVPPNVCLDFDIEILEVTN